MIETVPSGTILNGRYRVERVLGSGGFGHVYLVLDLTTNQQYALKEYLVSGPGGQEQLMHEANVLSQLHHPNLPAFHDAFNERGHYYVILNYIEGEDLTDIIRMAQRRNEVVPIIQVMSWILATCNAVFFLHNQRPPVIHRDIKPDNIRIMPNGTAILVDLGNAKAYEDGSRTLLFIRYQGTPGYAPPEQYPGGSGTDTRSDVYALGATLYFALTAHEPPSVSTRNQALQQGRPDLPSLQEILAQNPPENGPQANEAKQFRLGVSKPTKPAPRHSYHLAQLGILSSAVLNQLNMLLQRSMAMRPKDRYQFVADFANDLQRIMVSITTEVQQAKPTATSYSTQPDLPMLYEAMQDAKAAENQSTPSISQTPVPQSTLGSLSQCPQCNTTLMQSATFCPNCGISLGNSSRSGADVRTSIGNEQMQQGYDGGVGQTITSTPHKQPISRTYVPISTPTPPNNISPWNTASVVPQVPSYPNTISDVSSQKAVQQTPPHSSLTVSPKLVLATLLLLILFVLIMVVLLMNHV